MKRVNGNLIDLALAGEFDLIVHGCNCFHKMGAGIAIAIATEFPEVLAVDRQTPKGDKEKLGKISIAHIDRPNLQLKVVNAYTQFSWRGRGQKADYDAIRIFFNEIATRFPSCRIGYPLISAGLAGGDWNVIEPRISTALSGLNHTLVLFQG